MQHVQFLLNEMHRLQLRLQSGGFIPLINILGVNGNVAMVGMRCVCAYLCVHLLVYRMYLCACICVLLLVRVLINILGANGNLAMVSITVCVLVRA